MTEISNNFTLSAKALNSLTGCESFFTQCPTCSSNGASARESQLNLWACHSGQALCATCLPSRQGVGEPILQVRRSSYHDVVKIGEISKLADITGVQSYVINGAKVIFLRRRPQPRPPKGAVGASQCLVCSRHLQDVSHYCSLQCRLDGEAGVRHVSLRPGSSSGSSEGDFPLDHHHHHHQHQHYRELRHMGDVGSDSDYASNDSSSSLRDGSRKRKKLHPARAPIY